MKKLGRTLALLLALGLTLTPTLAADGTGYPDVAADAWYAEAALELQEKGIMTGMETGRFEAGLPVDRATAVVVLWRMEGCPAPTEAESFPDVQPWYAEAAAWAKEAGIAVGYDSGDLGGEDPVTREQLAVFFSRYAVYRGEPLAQGILGLYRDTGEVSGWAREALAHAVGSGLLQGDEAGRLHPQATADRAALAVMLHRLLLPVAG